VTFHERPESDTDASFKATLAAVTAEREYMGSGRARVWTYIIFAVVLVIGVLVANFAISNPETAKHGVDAFLGMPPFGFPAVAAVLGLLIYFLGLKLETDWPEALGALLVAGAIASAEMLYGWQKFELGGLVVVPYLFPAVAFIAMMGYSVVRSR
jgi:hypothetical protein